MSDADDGAEAEARAVLAANVIAARHRLGMTQAELAQASGIAQQQISRIEQGTRDARLDTLVRLAQALQVDADALLKRPWKK